MAFALDSIRRTSDTKPPRTLIYSTHGMGKTTFAANAPKPIFIQTEDGEGSLEIDTFGIAQSYDDVISALNALGEGDHDYKTVVIDSLDHLEPLVWQKTCEAHGWDSIESPGYGKGYVEADVYWRQIIWLLDALRNHKNMAVILTAHAQILKFESPEHEAFDRYDIKLHKRANGMVQELVDVILFANHKMHVLKEDQGFNKSRARGITTGERVMYTVEKPAFVAKNRYSLPEELPLNWQAFEEALALTRKTSAAQPQPEPAAPDEGDQVAAAG